MYTKKYQYTLEYNIYWASTPASSSGTSVPGTHYYCRCKCKQVLAIQITTIWSQIIIIIIIIMTTMIIVQSAYNNTTLVYR